MNKILKSLLVLFLAFLFGSCFGVSFVQAQNNEFVLEVVKKCDIQYSGDSCIADIKLTNNTGEILDGKAFLHIDYQGICEDGYFDGSGIEAQFSHNGNDNWLNFSGLENGTAIVSGFDIVDGETLPELKIETVSNLCPGKYTFNLGLQGSGKTEETYTAGTIIGGSSGSGGTAVPRLTISREPTVDIVASDTSVTIQWLTSYHSTSQVIYSVKGEPPTPKEPHIFQFNKPYYGYAHAYPDPEDFTKKVNHIVVIPDLLSGRTYYYRTVSHASPPTISREYSFTTLGVKGATTQTQGDGQANGSQEQAFEPELEQGTGIAEKIVQGIFSILGQEPQQELQQEQDKEILSLDVLDNLGLSDSSDEKVGVEEISEEVSEDIEEKDSSLNLTASMFSAFGAFFNTLKESVILPIAVIFFFLLLIIASAKFFKNRKNKI